MNASVFRKRPENPYRAKLGEFSDIVSLEVSRIVEPIRSCSRPLFLDLGCGNGDFTVALASGHPDADCIGVEIKYKRVYKSAKKAQRAGLGNVRFYCGDVFRFLEELPPGSISKIFVNFPDPWPKRRQLRRRFIQPPVFSLIRRALKPEGVFYFRTDVGKNRELAVAVFELTQLRLVSRKTFSRLSDLERIGEMVTYYERMFLRSGRQAYHLEAVPQF